MILLAVSFLFLDNNFIPSVEAQPGRGTSFIQHITPHISKYYNSIRDNVGIATNMSYVINAVTGAVLNDNPYDPDYVQDFAYYTGQSWLLHVYRLTGNQTYLDWAKAEYNFIFSNLVFNNLPSRYSVDTDTPYHIMRPWTLHAIISQLGYLYDITRDPTYKQNFETWIEALHTNFEDPTTHLPYGSINVSTLEIVDDGVRAGPITDQVCLYAYAYYLTGDSKYKTWARDTADYYMNNVVNQITYLSSYKINATTGGNIYAYDSIEDTGVHIVNFAQAYIWTKDPVFLDYAEKIASATLTYHFAKGDGHVYQWVYHDGSGVPSGGERMQYSSTTSWYGLQLLYYITLNSTYIDKMEQSINYYRTHAYNKYGEPLYFQTLNNDTTPYITKARPEMQSWFALEYAWLAFLKKNAVYLDYANETLYALDDYYWAGYGWITLKDLNGDTIEESCTRVSEQFMGQVAYACALLDYYDNVDQGTWADPIPYGYKVIYSFDTWVYSSKYVTLKGLYDESTGLLLSTGVNVTAKQIGYATQTFEVNGTYRFFYDALPIEFIFDLTNDRHYIATQDGETIYIYQLPTSTVYTIHFLDLVGVLNDYPYVELSRYINGVLRTVEKRKVDLEKKVTFAAQQEETYVITIKNGASYVFGDLLFGQDTTMTLTLKGLEFPEHIVLGYKYVRVYATRNMTSGTPITIFYQDTLDETTQVDITIYFQSNDTVAWSTTQTASSFSVNWNGADNTTDYWCEVIIDHQRFAILSYRQILPRLYSGNPWSLDFLGTLPFNTNLLIPAFIVLCVAGVFSSLNVPVGLFATVITATILAYLGWLPVHADILIFAFALVIIVAIAYGKRRVYTV
jgi:hypothetical protein